MEKQDEYHRRIAISRHDSFLVATAFLITAFATVVILSKDNCSMLRLAHAVNWVGLYLAIFFTIANYHAMLRAKNEDAELDLVFRGISSELWGLIRDPTSSAKRSTELIHTWIIPLFFVIFWIFTWFFVLDYWQVPTVGISIPFIYLCVQIAYQWRKRRT